MTNQKFAETNEEFIHACGKIPWKDKEGKSTTLPPTSRQASKWRNKQGLAWKKGR